MDNGETLGFAKCAQPNLPTLVGDDWTSDRVETVYEAHAIAAHLHGGVENFQADVGEYTIKHKEGFGGAMVWPTGNHMIISDGYLDTHSTQTVVHEIGHVFDFKNSVFETHYDDENNIWSFSVTRPSDSFVSEFSPDSGCSSSAFLGCVNPDPSVGYNSSRALYSAANLFVTGSRNRHYSSSGDTTKYGYSGSLDDYAESYAYTAYMDLNIAYPEEGKVDKNRMMMIHASIDKVHY